MTEMVFIQLLTAIPSNWKNIIKQNNDSNTFTTTEHHFIRNLKSPYDSKSNFKRVVLDTYDNN